MLISEEVKQLRKSIMENPKDWCVGEYRVVHAPTRISLWVANGFESLNFEQGGKTLNIFEKFHLWGTFKKLTILKIISKEV